MLVNFFGDNIRFANGYFYDPVQTAYNNTINGIKADFENTLDAPSEIRCRTNGY